MRMPRVLALVVGFVIFMQGFLGVTLPDPFVGLVGAFQAPPVLYVAAVLRMTFGAILFLAAPSSRLPLALRVLGGLIFLGGVLTPVIGIAFAESILAWWKEGGPPMVRFWGVVAMAMGGTIIYAALPRRED